MHRVRMNTEIMGGPSLQLCLFLLFSVLLPYKLTGWLIIDTTSTIALLYIIFLQTPSKQSKINPMKRLFTSFKLFSVLSFVWHIINQRTDLLVVR